MATFAIKEGNTADIDPELLTVNLLGSEPDPDDLVITPQNEKSEKSEELSDSISPADSEDLINPPDSENSISEQSDSSEDESINTIIKRQNIAPEKEGTPDELPAQNDEETSDEAEIKEIEALLRSKKSTRTKKQKDTIEDRKPSVGGKRKIDPIVIVSAVVAAVLIFVFAAYFLGFFDRTNSLKMTLEEFSSSYAKTAAYKSISTYGFAFPDITLNEDTTSTDASSSTKVSDVRSFSANITNTVNYQMGIIGSVNKSDGNIKAMQVVMRLSNSSSFKDVLVVYAPYVQVLYPDMSTQDAAAYLSTLYTSTEPVTIKGNYGLSFQKGSDNGSFYLALSIASAKDARDYVANYAASTTVAADSSVADSTAAQAATTAATTAAA